jgi:para-nitrobenzyl esterase
LHQAEATDKAFAEAAFGTSSLAALRELSTDDVIKGAMAKGAPRFGPDIDGYFLPDTLPHLYAAGLQAHVPLLAGWNADESRSGVIHAKVKPTAESFAAEAKARYGADAPEFLAAYTATTDEEALRSAGDYAGDRFIAYSTWRWLEAQVETGGAPVYRYFFALGAPIDDIHPAGTGAYHSDDIEYVFGALDSRPGVQLRAEDRMLSDEMGRYWTNFARTGDPNGPGLPEWPTYGPKGGWQVMHLDAHTEAKPDALRGRYVFLETHTSAPPRP